MSEYKRVRAKVSGYVQGVGYRFYAVQLARRLGVSGWVRNSDDGAVEAVAEGEAGMVREFLDGLRTGPASAEVRDVQVTPEPYAGEYTRFDVTY